MINKYSNNLALSAIFQYFWRRFPSTVQTRGFKTVRTILFPVKFRRCAEGAEKLRFYLNTIKLTDNFISCFFFRLTVKYLKSGARKINHYFLKMPYREPSQNFSRHAAG